MDSQSIPGVRFGEDPSDPTLVIDLVELCAWAGVPCDAHNCDMIRTVVGMAFLILASEVRVEDRIDLHAEEGVPS